MKYKEVPFNQPSLTETPEEIAEKYLEPTPLYQQEVTPPTAPIAETGASVSLEDYYTGLRKTLEKFGPYNQAENDKNRFDEGLDFLVTRKKPNMTPVEATRIMGVYSEKAQNEFATPFGTAALKTSGLKTDRAIGISEDNAFLLFKEQYAGTDNVKARGNYIARIDRRLERLHKNSQEEAA